MSNQPDDTDPLGALAPNEHVDLDSGVTVRRTTDDMFVVKYYDHARRVTRGERVVLDYADVRALAELAGYEVRE